jgi:hypothetical protein
VVVAYAAAAADASVLACSVPGGSADSPDTKSKSSAGPTSVSWCSGKPLITHLGHHNHNLSPSTPQPLFVCTTQ